MGEQVVQHFSAESVFEANKKVSGFVERDYSKPLHTQGFYEVNIVLRGSAIHTVGERSMTVSEGDTFIIPPNVPHAYDGGEGFDVYHILISPGFLERNSADLYLLPGFSSLFIIDPLLREKTSARLHFRLDDHEISELSPMLAALTRHSGADSASDRILTNCRALMIVVFICSAYQKRADEMGGRGIGNDGLASSIAYLYENYHRHVTVDELTRVARMSRTAFMAGFKRVTGVSPGRFQANYRVERAKQMLSDSSLSISDIAAEVGCFDTSHLIRIFSAQCGMTPGEYRLSRREKDG